MPEFTMRKFDRETCGREARAEIAQYDSLIAEFSAEKSARARKYMRTHDVRNVRKNAGRAYIKERAWRNSPWPNHGYASMAEYRIAEKLRTDAEDEKTNAENYNAEISEIAYWGAVAEGAREAARYTMIAFMDPEACGYEPDWAEEYMAEAHAADSMVRKIMVGLEI